MGLLDFLSRLFSRGRSRPQERVPAAPPIRKQHRRARLLPLRNGHSHKSWARNATIEAGEPAYAFARIVVGSNRFLDLSQDGDPRQLAKFGLPSFETPAELAAWAGIPLGRLAWLVHRFEKDARPKNEAEAHYHFRWIAKRRGGRRLIESPKRKLKELQRKILREIVAKVPPHSAAHGFAPGRSILSNAEPHVGQALLLKFDLANFYATVTFARVTAIFRGFGYSREAAIWLARLTTSALPSNIPFLKEDPSAVLPYLRCHLPQGAPTSPALANLSAYSLDVRLGGMARAFGANYTRYADDLTFSGSESFSSSLRDFIPLVEQIIRQERFRVNACKRKVLRPSGALVVTGVVVNQKLNISRREFDRLKAVLTNCVREGPLGQNRARHPRFAAHLRGRIAHVAHLNAARGNKLLALYDRIDWNH